jgi:aryl-alcohol dehydrogenase-like predicted oxidoreductase
MPARALSTSVQTWLRKERNPFGRPSRNGEFANSAVATAHGASVARVALAYVLAKPFVTTVIIGAKTMEQLDDNLASATLTLSAEEITALDKVSALPPEYPGWMLARQGAERIPRAK